MTLKGFKDILRNGSDEVKQEAISKAGPELLNTDIFFLLFDLLKDSNPHNRFFAIFHLIDKFSKSLTNIDGTYISDVYELLFDEFAPVADRAIWALSIVGDKALDKLIEEYYSETADTQTQIIYAIGRGNFSQRSKERIQVLLDGLQSENEKLKFTAMCEIMSNTPISPWCESEWNSTQDENIDFEEIYDIILPIAKEFASSRSETFKEFSTRYINWIVNRKNL